MKNRQFFRIISCLLAMVLVFLTVPETMISAFVKEGAITWEFDPEAGLLTVSGIGDIPDYRCRFLHTSLRAKGDYDTLKHKRTSHFR